jgi:hypothetical protein
VSIYTFELTDKPKVHSYKTTWDSYLDSLKQNKGGESVTGMITFQPLFWGECDRYDYISSIILFSQSRIRVERV